MLRAMYHLPGITLNFDPILLKVYPYSAFGNVCSNLDQFSRSKVKKKKKNILVQNLCVFSFTFVLYCPYNALIKRCAVTLNQMCRSVIQITADLLI